MEIIDKLSELIRIRNSGDISLSISKHQEIIDFIKDFNHTLLDEKELVGGNTALIKASYEGFSDIVKALIKAGANPNVQNNVGNTALIIATRMNDIYTVKAILDEFIITDEFGKSGRYYKNPKTGQEMMLLDTAKNIIIKVDVNIQNNDGVTALLNACNNNNLDMVKLLLDKGADPNIKNNFQSTALHDAVYKGNKDVVIALLSNKKTDKTILNRDKETPYDIAKKFLKTGDNEIAKLLKEEDKKEKDGKKSKRRKSSKSSKRRKKSSKRSSKRHKRSSKRSSILRIKTGTSWSHIEI